MIAVTGAGGSVGGRVARTLAAQGLHAAFEGAETVYLVSGSESAGRVAEHFSAVDAAAAAGVARVVLVYVSALAAGDLEPTSDAVERILGRPPRSPADVLREHPESLAHLRR